MKIGQFDSKPVAPPVASPERKASADTTHGTDSSAASAAAAAASATGASPDSSTLVELSSQAAGSGAIDAGGSTPEFDSAKVDRISQAIREGKFTVNHEAIADKLISNAQEVLSSRVAH